MGTLIKEKEKTNRDLARLLWQPWLNNESAETGNKFIFGYSSEDYRLQSLKLVFVSSDVICELHIAGNRAGIVIDTLTNSVFI